MIKQKIFLVGLLISFLLCYLEWGGNNSSFLFQTEYSLFMGQNTSSDNFMHPLILIPFAGQILLMFLLIQKNSSRALTYTAIILMGILVLFILLVGIIALNIKIISSTLPFLIISVMIFRTLKKTN